MANDLDNSQTNRASLRTWRHAETQAGGLVVLMTIGSSSSVAASSQMLLRSSAGSSGRGQNYTLAGLALKGLWLGVCEIRTVVSALHDLEGTKC